LDFINFRYRLRGLHFDDDSSVNPQISAVHPHHLTLVDDSDGLLLLDVVSQLFKLNAKRVFVNFFQEA